MTPENEREHEIENAIGIMEERYCEGNNCGNPLTEEEELETGLCNECYQKDMQREIDERRHPDEQIDLNGKEQCNG